MWRKKKEQQEELAAKKREEREEKKRKIQEAADEAATEIDFDDGEPVDPAICKALIDLRDSIRLEDEWDELEETNTVSQLISLHGLTFTTDNKLEIRLSGLGLTGTIPSSISSLTSLGTLDLSDNQLDGELPLSLIELKCRGCDVELRDNAGFLLPSNASELAEDIERLDLRSCSLVGKVPDEWLNHALPRMNAYAFDGNDLEIPPSSLHNYLILERTTLVDPALTELNLSDSNMRSTIPPALTYLTSLTSLVLKRNYLCGVLPSSVCWGRLQLLVHLDLSCNMLEGCIPLGVGTEECMPKLTELNVSNNPSLGGEVGVELLSRVGLLKVDVTGCNRDGGHRPSPKMRGIQCWEPNRLGKFSHRLPAQRVGLVAGEEAIESEEERVKRRIGREAERVAAAKEELEEMKTLRWELGKEEERKRQEEDRQAKQDAEERAREEAEEWAREEAEAKRMEEEYDQDATRWDEVKVAEEIYNIGTKAAKAVEEGDGEVSYIQRKFEEYAEAFEERGIDGPSMLELGVDAMEERVLEEEMGVADPEHKRVIMEWIVGVEHRARDANPAFFEVNDDQKGQEKKERRVEERHQEGVDVEGTQDGGGQQQELGETQELDDDEDDGDEYEEEYDDEELGFEREDPMVKALGCP
jgi:hypothetical protein